MFLFPLPFPGDVISSFFYSVAIFVVSDLSIDSIHKVRAGFSNSSTPNTPNVCPNLFWEKKISENYVKKQDLEHLGCHKASNSHDKTSKLKICDLIMSRIQAFDRCEIKVRRTENQLRRKIFFLEENHKITKFNYKRQRRVVIDLKGRIDGVKTSLMKYRKLGDETSRKLEFAQKTAKNQSRLIRIQRKLVHDLRAEIAEGKKEVKNHSVFLSELQTKLDEAEKTIAELQKFKVSMENTISVLGTNQYQFQQKTDMQSILIMFFALLFIGIGFYLWTKRNSAIEKFNRVTSSEDTQRSQMMKCDELGNPRKTNCKFD